VRLVGQRIKLEIRPSFEPPVRTQLLAGRDRDSSPKRPSLHGNSKQSKPLDHVRSEDPGRKMHAIEWCRFETSGGCSATSTTLLQVRSSSPFVRSRTRNACSVGVSSRGWRWSCNRAKSGLSPRLLGIPRRTSAGQQGAMPKETSNRGPSCSIEESNPACSSKVAHEAPERSHVFVCPCWDCGIVRSCEMPAEKEISGFLGLWSRAGAGSAAIDECRS
jgi:hypothetical protein